MHLLKFNRQGSLKDEYPTHSETPSAMQISFEQTMRSFTAGRSPFPLEMQESLWLPENEDTMQNHPIQHHNARVSIVNRSLINSLKPYATSGTEFGNRLRKTLSGETLQTESSKPSNKNEELLYPENKESSKTPQEQASEGAPKRLTSQGVESGNKGTPQSFEDTLNKMAPQKNPLMKAMSINRRTSFISKAPSRKRASLLLPELEKSSSSNIGSTDQQATVKLREADQRYESEIERILLEDQESVSKEKAPLGKIVPVPEVRYSESRNFAKHKFSTSRVIDPRSPWKTMWDNLVLVVVVFSSIVVPLLVGFDALSQARVSLRRLSYSMYGCDVVFVFDLILTFRTGFTGFQGKVVMDPKEIAREYLRGWFIVDFVSTFPFEIFSLVPGINAGKRVWSCLKLPRLLRMVRLLKKFNKIKGGHTMRISCLLFGFLMMAHWISCAWFFIGTSQKEEGMEHNTWTAVQDITTQDTSIDWAYVTSIYWALTTMTTVGYGDIAPISATERWYTIFVFLVGSILYSSIFANVSILLQNLDAIGNRYRARMDAVGELLLFFQVDADVAERVITNVDRNFTLVGGFNPQKELEHLPRALRVEVCMNLYGRIVRMAPMFRNVHRSLIQEIVTRLVPLAYDPGDWIFHEGDVGHEMMFIGSGILAVVGGSDQDVIFAQLTQGSILGETALFFSPSRRTASVRALTLAELYSITKQDFEEVLIDFPQELADMIEIAEEQRRNNIMNHKRLSVTSSDFRAEDNTPGLALGITPRAPAGVLVPPSPTIQRLLTRTITLDSTATPFLRVESQKRQSQLSTESEDLNNLLNSIPTEDESLDTDTNHADTVKDGSAFVSRVNQTEQPDDSAKISDGRKPDSGSIENYEDIISQTSPSKPGRVSQLKQIRTSLENPQCSSESDLKKDRRKSQGEVDSDRYKSIDGLEVTPKREESAKKENIVGYHDPKDLLSMPYANSASSSMKRIAGMTPALQRFPTPPLDSLQAPAPGTPATDVKSLEDRMDLFESKLDKVFALLERMDERMKSEN